MKHKKLIWQLPVLVFLIIGTILILREEPPFRTNEGYVFGTIYKVTYQYDKDLQQEIEHCMQAVDDALSPFNEHSIISALNQNRDTTLNEAFTTVFQLAQTISRQTNGNFDITVAPLVNAWGFGFKHASEVNESIIDSLLQFVGYEKIHLEQGKILKDDPRIMLDCSSIAKGYGVDEVARLLTSKGIRNYMVDIGGEVDVKGKNAKMNTWRIGINQPTDDSLHISQGLQTILQISDVGMATSGNYRRFYYKDGKRYAHTINPHTGYPVQKDVLSATVIAHDCVTADAYATAFMVMGMDAAMQFCAEHPEIQAYLICEGNSNYEIHMTEGLRQYIRKN